MRQRLDRASQFHPIVRRVFLSAAELGHLAVRRDADDAPAARTGIAFRRAVAEDDDGKRVSHRNPPIIADTRGSRTSIGPPARSV